MAGKKIKAQIRYAMTRWTGLKWVHHSTLSRTETRAMIASLRPEGRSLDLLMGDLEEGLAVQAKGYRWEQAS